MSLKKKIYKYVQVVHNNASVLLSFSQVQKIPNFAYQIFQTLQIYSVYEKDFIKYKYDRR